MNCGLNLFIIDPDWYKFDILTKIIFQETYKEGLMQVNANLIKQHDYFVEAIQESDKQMRQIDDRVDDKLDKFQWVF